MSLKTLMYVTVFVVSTTVVCKSTRQNVDSECNRVMIDGDPTRIVCKCNATYCDSHPFDWPSNVKHVLHVESSEAGKRFYKTLIDLSNSSTTEGEDADILIELDINKQHQQVLGYGGGLTDTSASIIQSFQEQVRKHIMSDYFGKNGADYNLVRVPIGGSDFSSRPYTLADLPDDVTQDFELKYFSLSREDIKLKIPVLKLVEELRAESPLVFSSCWSSPAWLKTNNNLVRGHLKHGKQYRDAYANYLIKFLDEYTAQNVSIFALSPQNEPVSPTLLGEKFLAPSVEFSPTELRKFLEQSLVPKLNISNHTKVNLIGWDDSTSGVFEYLDQVFASPSIWSNGFAVHWYEQSFNPDTYSDLNKISQRLSPLTWLISTEASLIGVPLAGNWTNAERYAHNIIANLVSSSVGWIDWNLVLNMDGGFSWTGHKLDAPILADVQQNFYYKNPMYYALIHMSRFISANSYIVQTHMDNRKGDHLVHAVGAELPPLGGSNNKGLRRVALVVLNRRSTKLNVRINACGQGINTLFNITLDVKSISSFALNC